MFSWILENINATICKRQGLPFVGVLDIFGFEDFKDNRFIFIFIFIFIFYF